MSEQTIRGRQGAAVEEYIKKHEGEMTRKEMSEELGIPYKELLNFISARGLATRKVHEWTEEETKFLVDNFQTMTKPEICEHLGRSWASVNTKAQYMGLTKRERHKWTQAEKDKVMELYRKGVSHKDIAAVLGRPVRTVSAQILIITNAEKARKKMKARGIAIPEDESDSN